MYKLRSINIGMYIFNVLPAQPSVTPFLAAIGQRTVQASQEGLANGKPTMSAFLLRSFYLCPKRFFYFVEENVLFFTYKYIYKPVESNM